MAKRTGVQLPTVDRIGPIAPPREGQLDTRVPDLSGPSKALAQGVSQLGNTIIQGMENAEKEFAETESTSHSNTFDEWAGVKFNGEKGKGGLIHEQGDPTDLYSTFDDEAESFKQSLINQDDYSPRVKRAIEKKLASKHNQINNQKSVLYGQQYRTYSARVTESAVSLNKQGAMEDAGFVVPGDAATTAPFEQRINDISDDRVRQAISIGTASEAKGGEYNIVDDDNVDGITSVNLSNSVKVQIAKDTSDATFGAINNLIASDKLDSAEFMMKRYGNLLDPVNKAKLTKSFELENVKEKGLEIMSKVEGKPIPEQRAMIKKLSKGDPEVAQAAYKQLGARERYKSNLSRLDSKQVYDGLAIKIHEKMKSNDPYTSTLEMEEDPEFRRLIGRVTDAKQRETLFGMVEKPKNSDPAAVLEAMDLIAQDKFFGMPIEEFEQVTTNMAKSDFNFFRNQYLSIKTETDSKERARQNYTAGVIKQAFEAGGLLKKSSRGRVSKRSQRELADFTKRTLEKYSNQIGMTDQEIRKNVNRDLGDEILRQNAERTSVFDKVLNFFGEKQEPAPAIVKPPIRTRGGGRVSTPSNNVEELPASGSGPKTMDQLTASQLTDAYKQFGDAHEGRDPESEAELMNWYNERNGN